MSLKAIQQALADHGHAPGPIDGLWGRRTEAALHAVIAAKGKPGRGAPAPVVPITSSTIWQGSARYPVSGIVVHCSDTRPDWMAGRPLSEKRAEIDRWHREERKFSMIGYHWIIDRDGQMLACRPETMIGAHVVEANRGTIGVCLLGGYGSAATDRFNDHFTAAQDRQLRAQILGISIRTRIERVSGHNEWARKACPGFDVPAWLDAA